MEIWKDIPGYEGHYQVSDLGKNKSLKFGKERILKPSKDTGGYNQIDLRLEGGRKTVNVCKLVAIAFLGHMPRKDGLVVDHINGIRTDDRLSNLQLITQRENSSKDRWRQDYSSKYVGVSWNKSRKKWVAQIYINKSSCFLGRFNTELEAHEAYQKALKNL